MINRTSDHLLARLFARSARSNPRNSAASINRRAGRTVRADSQIEALENRILLGIDQPGFPTPFVAGTGQLVALMVAAANLPANGRGEATGTISSAADDDMFRFVMPGAPGTRDFVSVLADTIEANSTLDSYVQIYNNSGTLLATGAHNGVLSSTAPRVASDGWAGFVGEGGMTYYIRVRSQQGAIGPGKTATGNYNIKIDAATIALPLDTAFDPAPPKGADTFGNGLIDGELTELQEDIVYRVTTGVGANWDSVAIANGVAADFALLDVHLSVYDGGNMLGQVVQVRDDRQGGRLTNAYLAFSSSPDSTFFFRVRSDELSAANPSLGQFVLAIDMAALALPVDPVTHLSAPPRRDNVFGPDTLGIPGLIGINAPAGTGAKLYQFQAQGSGLSIITVLGQASGLIPRLPDPAIHLYNRAGFEVAFNDDFNGTTPQLEVSLTGGDDYFLVVEGFDRSVDGAINVFIEASHTFGPTIPVDDHINSTPGTIANFENATPLIFGAPTLLFDGEGDPANPTLDRSWIQTAAGRGRIHDDGDTDVFQFVPPVDMLGEYDGDDGGNRGRALYVGGNFAQAGAIDAENVAVWDADRWWFAGAAVETSGAIDGHIFAMTQWDPDGAGARFPTILVAGGDFDNVGGVPNTNLAFRIFSGGRWIWSATLDPNDPTLPPLFTNGPVFALAAFDTVTATTPQELIIGGDFTDVSGIAVNNIIGIGFDAGALFGDNMLMGVRSAAIGSGVVRALTVFDPEQEEDPDGMGPMMAPMDRPAALYVGGGFTMAGAVLNVNNIASFGRAEADITLPNVWRALGSSNVNGGGLGVTGGEVFALASMPIAYVDSMMMDAEENVLVVGGSFTNRGGRLAAWSASRLDGTLIAADGRWINTLSAPGAVRALHTWFPPDAAGDTGDVPLMIAAGDNSLVAEATGIVRFWDGAAFGTLATSTTGTFRTLEAFEDDEPVFVSAFEVLYVGGDFQDIGGDGTISTVAKFDLGPFGFQWFDLDGGVSGESPAPPTQVGEPRVSAIHQMDDNIAGVWDRLERQSTRVGMVLSPTGDAFFNSFIRVFDSNLNLIYQNETIAPPFPDPSGAIDGTIGELSGPATDTAAPGFQVWGGEVYYIEVSASGGFGTGRYSLSITVDALPPQADPNNDTGAHPDVISGVFEVPGEGQFPIAPELSVNVDTGDTRNFLNPHGNPPSSFYTRVYDITPAGIIVQHNRDLSVIEHVSDTDLYKFRAPSTGTVEIRLSTLAITSQFQEQQIDVIANMVEAILKQKTFNSPLDGVIRVFNNDFEEIASPNPDSEFYVVGADDPFEVGGRSDVTFAGSFAGRTFSHRDPRIVLDVVGGETYFIQVESAFRLIAESLDPTIAARVDWRHATGAYELLINATPELNGIDDHAIGVQASPIPINPTTGQGDISGEIDDVVSGVFQNPNDDDGFAGIATATGFYTVTVNPSNALLEAATAILDANFNLVTSNNDPTPGGAVMLTFFLTQGERFFVSVDGANGSEGGYLLTVSAPPITDDHADDGDWTIATELVLQPFFGTATAEGNIENPDDTDLFYFDAQDFETAIVSIAAANESLDSFVRVYEQNLDGTWNPNNAANSGNPVFQQIAFNDDIAVGTPDSSVAFSMTAGRRYWFVVSGFDPDLHFGEYTITVRVAATDDHPDLVDFPLGTQISLVYNGLTQTGTGTADGNIEQSLDTDLFRFTAPATGTAQVTITTPDGGLAPRVEVRDQNNTVVVAATSGTNGTVTVTIPSIIINQQYYIVVTPGTVGAGQPDGFGTYTVAVGTMPVDDHPNTGEFGLIQNPRDVILLAPSTAVGTGTGVIVPGTDSDLFRFTVLESGSTTVRITTTGSSLNPQVRVFNAAFALIGSGTGNGDAAEVVFNSGVAGTVYYVLVLPDAAAIGATAVGSYTVQITGQIEGGGGPGPIPDDHANAGEFGDATIIALSGLNGQGNATGVINYTGDTDLFRFTTLAAGRVWLQVNVPAGGLIDGRVKVFDAATNLLVQDSAGIPGATAALSFNASAAANYYALVEPIGAATGSYALRVAGQPLTQFLYFAEGFSGPGVDEFVPIVNPNAFAVTFQVFAHYETGTIQTTPIFSGSIPANSRGGVTVFTKSNPGASLVRLNTPYSLEIRSSAQLGATLSRYDFDVAVGESFNNQTSTTWTFAQVHKDPSLFRDFLVFYNPNATDQLATIELFYSDGQRTTFTQNIRGNRRSGINIDTDGRVSREGSFGVRITTSQPIVSALSSYNIVNGGGDGLNGDSTGGAIEGVVPQITSGSGVSTNISILNTGTITSTVTIRASYSRLDLPDLVRVYNVGAGRVLNLTGQQLGLLSGQQAGLRYTASTPVTLNTFQYRNGDGDATNTATVAALEYVIGDAYVVPAQAGINYLEQLGIYNPSAATIQVDIDILFFDGATATQTITIGADDFAFIAVDQFPAVLSRTGAAAFSLVISAATPIVVAFTHYDLNFNGGWGTLAAPIGLTNPLSTI